MLWAAYYRKLQLKVAEAINKNIVYVTKACMGMVWGSDQQLQILGHLVDGSVIL